MKDNATTKEHLIECAPEAWETLEVELTEKLASAMQNRIEAMKKAQGWYTKYEAAKSFFTI